MEEKEKNHLGVVVSTQNSPNTEFFYFVVTSGKVKRGQFVKLDVPEGTLLALITDIFKSNKYFERADSVKEFENRGSSILEQFPASEWEYTVAVAKPLGLFQEGQTGKLAIPPSPGCRVFSADNLLLKKFYNMDDEGLYIGNVEAHNLQVKLNMTKLLKKHLAILSISGAGKSYCASVLFEELLSRSEKLGRIACIVFDPHGEYSCFAEPSDGGFTDFSSKTIVIKGSDIRISVSSFGSKMLSSLATGLSTVQLRALNKAIATLKEQMRSGSGPFELKDIMDAVKKLDDIKDATKDVVISWLSDIESMQLFAKLDYPNIAQITQPGKLVVIDLSDIIDMKKKQVIVSYFSQELFNLRRKEKIPPFLLVIEESHQFCPEKTKEENAISRNIIRTIAREGRKFGACLCLISQRPVHLDTTTLSQCNTKIILRIVNPYDLKHIAESAEAIDQRSLEMLTSLPVGEALIVGEAVGYPLFFRVRKRRSKPSKHETTLEDEAKKFELKKEKDQMEAQAFL
ncbi:MAG: ATP-binding protein [Candidatus Diapherotrites archaeon]